jgi:polyphosphate kinase
VNYGLVICEAEDLTKAEAEWVEQFFLAQVFPVLTPLACDPAHPFPFIPNLGFSLILELQRTAPHDPHIHIVSHTGNTQVGGSSMTALIRVPATLSRFIELPADDEKPGRL